ALALWTLGLEADCHRQLLVCPTLLERRGVTAQEQVDLTFLGINAAAAASLHRRTEIGPCRLGLRGKGRIWLCRQQHEALRSRKCAKEGTPRGRRPKRIAGPDFTFDHG